MAFKIYTKTGDEGKTGLIGGTRVAKNNIRIEAYGTIDELNSWLGIVYDQIIENKKAEIQSIQNNLFNIGSLLACDPNKDIKMQLPHIDEHDVVLLEKSIDSMEIDLPALKNFILPGGYLTASHIHVARCVCRRAERICVAMQLNNEKLDAQIIKYLNRLSDYLFTLARYTLHIAGGTETLWQNK